MLYMCGILLLAFYFYCVTLIVDCKHGHAILFVILCCCRELFIFVPRSSYYYLLYALGLGHYWVKKGE